MEEVDDSILFAYCCTSQPENISRLAKSIAAQTAIGFPRSPLPSARILIFDGPLDLLTVDLIYFFGGNVLSCDPFVLDANGKSLFCLSKFRNTAIQHARMQNVGWLFLCDSDTVFTKISPLDIDASYCVPNVYWQRDDQESIYDSLKVLSREGYLAFSAGNSWFVLCRRVFSKFDFNENVYGYGYEDLEFNSRVLSAGFVLRPYDATIVHMYHDSASRRVDDCYYQRNFSIFGSTQAFLARYGAFEWRSTFIYDAGIHGVIVHFVDAGLFFCCKHSCFGRSVVGDEDYLAIAWESGWYDVFQKSQSVLERRSRSVNVAVSQASATFTRFPARHPHWSGELDLDFENKIVYHVKTGQRGTFKLERQNLTIYWDSFGVDLFVLDGSAFSSSGLKAVSRSEEISSLCERLHNSAFELHAVTVNTADGFRPSIRLKTSDEKVFEQVFVNKEYAIGALPAEPKIIFDVGANVGYATLYFRSLYPSAKIVAVEPDLSNFTALKTNVSSLENIEIYNSAIWGSDTTLNLITTDQEGDQMEAWAFKVESGESRFGGNVRAFTIASLMAIASVDYIDVLKIDIEGAELEVFSALDLNWLEKVGMILIETHERFRPGSDATVRRALSGIFVENPQVGENLVFVNKCRI